MSVAWPFGDLVPLSYDLVCADPPWHFDLWSEKGEEKSPQAQYQTMTMEDIAALPVGHLAARDCVLFMWTTWPLLLDGDNPGRSKPGEVMKAWGFRYVTGGSWTKRTPAGKLRMGPGYRVRSVCEPFLIGVAGDPSTPGASRARNMIDGIAREHSRKPEEAYAWLEAYMPAARRLDLFSRQRRPGWDSWGNETDKFEAVA